MLNDDLCNIRCAYIVVIHCANCLMYLAPYSDQTVIAICLVRCELIAIGDGKPRMVIARGFLEKPPHNTRCAGRCTHREATSGIYVFLVAAISK